MESQALFYVDGCFGLLLDTEPGTKKKKWDLFYSPRWSVRQRMRLETETFTAASRMRWDKERNHNIHESAFDWVPFESPNKYNYNYLGGNYLVSMKSNGEENDGMYKRGLKLRISLFCWQKQELKQQLQTVWWRVRCSWDAHTLTHLHTGRLGLQAAHEPNPFFQHCLSHGHESCVNLTVRKCISLCGGNLWI